MTVLSTSSVVLIKYSVVSGKTGGRGSALVEVSPSGVVILVLFVTGEGVAVDGGGFSGEQ